MKLPTSADPCRSAKLYKIQPHHFLDCDYSVYVDGNFLILDDVTRLVSSLRSNLGFYRHPERQCIYEEAEACIAQRKDDPELIRKQMARYRKTGYPSKNGLVVGAVIVRRHTPDVAALNAAWWKEIEAGSRRDQLSFNYVAAQLIMSYDTIPGFWESNQYLKRMPHRR